MKNLWILLLASLFLSFSTTTSATPLKIQPLGNIPNKLPKAKPLPKNMTPPAHITCVYRDKEEAVSRNKVVCPIGGLTDYGHNNPYNCKVDTSGCRFNFWSALRKGEICFGTVICTKIQDVEMPTWNSYGQRSQLVQIPKSMIPPAHLTCFFENNKKDIYCHITGQKHKKGGTFNCRLLFGTIGGMYSVLKPGELSLAYYTECLRNNPITTPKLTKKRSRRSNTPINKLTP